MKLDARSESERRRRSTGWETVPSKGAVQGTRCSTSWGEPAQTRGGVASANAKTVRRSALRFSTASGLAIIGRGEKTRRPTGRCTGTVRPPPSDRRSGRTNACTPARCRRVQRIRRSTNDVARDERWRDPPLPCRGSRSHALSERESRWEWRTIPSTGDARRICSSVQSAALRRAPSAWRTTLGGIVSFEHVLDAFGDELVQRRCLTGASEAIARCDQDQSGVNVFGNADRQGSRGRTRHDFKRAIERPTGVGFATSPALPL